MREQVRMLGVQDPLVRRDEPDAVHQMRVACRRLRSVLATYRVVLDTQAVKQLRDELQWLASALGQARDIEVIHERITDRLNTEPAELIAGPIAERIAQQLDADFHDARRSGLTALDSTRYFQLLNALDAFLAMPPVTKRGRKPASRIVPRLIRSEGQQLQRLVRAATATPLGSPARDLALHEVRKRAKRLRYSAETAIAVRRKAARRLVNAAQDVQTILGDHQDSVVARDLLLRLAADAHLRAESTFSYGRLHALEQASAATTDDAFLQAWARFPKPTVTS
jgi:CHAD domain-containing protein